MIMDATTEMLFNDPDGYFDMLTYGEDSLRNKMLAAYYRSNPSRFRAHRMLVQAGQIAETDTLQAFFILVTIQQEMKTDPAFLKLFTRVCRSRGFDIEADAYQSIQ